MAACLAICFYFTIFCSSSVCKLLSYKSDYLIWIKIHLMCWQHINVARLQMMPTYNKGKFILAYKITVVCRSLNYFVIACCYFTIIWKVRETMGRPISRKCQLFSLWVNLVQLHKHSFLQCYEKFHTIPKLHSYYCRYKPINIFSSLTIPPL